MKTILSLLILSLCITTNAQQFVDKAGKVHFLSKSPLEDIEATSQQAVCALNTETGKVFAKIPINSFRFQNKLMEEHFNENYLESDKIPYATLDAVIKEKIDYGKDAEYPVTLVGALDIHGVKKSYEIPGKLSVRNGMPTIGIAKFSVALADHKIKIPKVVVANIAEVIQVDVNFTFELYRRKE